jgi:integrase
MWIDDDIAAIFKELFYHVIAKEKQKNREPYIQKLDTSFERTLYCDFGTGKPPPAHVDKSITNQKETISAHIEETSVKEIEEMPIWEYISVVIRKNGLLKHQFTHNGKRECVYGRSKKECWQEREGIIAGKKKSKSAGPRTYTVEEWITHWYEVWHLANHKDNHEYNQSIQHHMKKIFAALGTIPLQKLDSSMLQKFFASLNPGALNICRMIVSSALKIAFNDGITKRNPYASVKIKAPKRESYKALTIADQRFIFNQITNEKYKAVFIYLCCSGMRLKEAINSIPHIDFNNYLLNVVDENKSTKKHKRQVPFMSDMLTAEQWEQLKNANYQMIQGYFKRFFRKYNLDYVVHSFRHTFASCCYHVGFKDKQIQTWLGHTQIDTTMNIYTTLLQNDGTSPIIEYLKRLKDRLGL